MKNRVLGIILLVAVAVFAASCGRNAKKAIGVAETAVADAKTAEAEQYAPEEYKGAEDYLAKARTEYDQRSYKPAEADAVASKDQAALAKKRALDRKAEGEMIKPPAAEEKPAEQPPSEDYNVSSLGEQPVPGQEQAAAALKDISFDFDSSELSEEAKEILVENVKWLEQHPGTRLTVEGHCDERGSIDYNLALGEQRGKSVRDYMVSLGVDHGLLNIVSFGESMPLDPGHDEDAWARNRRTHFAIIR